MENEEEIIEPTVDAETTENEEETVESLKQKLAAKDKTIATIEAQKEHFRKKASEPKKEEPVAQEGQFSMRDTLALVEAKVSSEDYEEVLRVAKILNKPIAEALKDKTLLSILNERVDERRTAEATHTRGGARSTSKVTGEDLLQKAERTGEVPDTEEGMQNLFLARQQRKVRK